MIMIMIIFYSYSLISVYFNFDFLFFCPPFLTSKKTKQKTKVTKNYALLPGESIVVNDMVNDLWYQNIKIKAPADDEGFFFFFFFFVITSLVPFSPFINF